MTVDENTKLSAIVLGGGTNDPLAAQLGVAAKAHVRVAGKPLARYVLEALQESKRVSYISYVGETLPELEPYINSYAPSGNKLSESLENGFNTVPDNAQRLLVLSADLPWLTGQGLDAFIATDPDIPLLYPIIPKAASEARFPGQARTYGRLVEGQFTGGNLIRMNADIMPLLLKFIDQVYGARKNPLALTRMVGLDKAIKLILRRASVYELERRVSKILGATARTVVSEDAGLGADIDKLEQLEYFDDS